MLVLLKALSYTPFVAISEILSTARSFSTIRRTMKDLLRLIGSAMLDVLAPGRCLVCTKRREESGYGHSDYICNSCLASFDPAPHPAVLMAELRRHFPGDDLMLSHVIARYAASHKTSTSLLDAVYALKYEGFSNLGAEFGRELGELMHFFSLRDYDLILPVPIHPARQRERGYNQASFIAEHVAQLLQVPCKHDLLRRTRYTGTQTRLSRTQRQHNVARAFALTPESEALVHDARILLIDDVLTTGSTLNSIATMLVEEGARRVDAATVVRAM